MSSSDGVVVRALDSVDSRRRWDVFVRGCRDATFFHLSQWKDLIENELRHPTAYFYAERAGQIIAVLPLAEMKSRLFGHALVSLPFCAYGGVAGEAAAAQALEARAEELAHERGVQHLEFRNLRQRHEDWPRQDLYVTFRKRIPPGDNANLLAVPRKQRAMIRKGMKLKLRSEIDTDVSRFFALYSDNVRRHGTPALPKRWFEELHRRFGDACDVLTVTDESGRPLSSVLSFYFRGEVLPYYAGDEPAARGLAANDFKYWQLMRHARARGCTIFDYGRSKVGTGPYSFKKNWGFEASPLSYEYRLYKRDSVPQNNPLNPKYAAFIALWRRLPRSITNVLGPRIARQLG